MKKILSLLVVTIFVLTGCNQTSTSGELVEIDLGVMPSMSAAPFIYAQEEGIYEQYGLDVNVQVFNSTPDINAALTAGQVTAVNNDVPSAILMQQDGVDVAISMATNDVFTLVAAPGSEYETIEDVEGGTIGLMEQSVTEYISTLVADEYDINFDVQHVPKLGDRFTALMNGELDFALICEPFAGLAAEQGGKTLWANFDGPFLTNITWQRSFVDENSEAYTAFHEATDQAVTEITEKGFDSYKQYLIDYQILTEDNIDVVTEQPFSPVDAADSEAFADMVDWMMEVGLLDQEVSYDDLFVDWR